MSKTVLIQCILIREGGTKVSIDETDYHFMDDGDGNHVAPVTIQKHIDRFMGIPEGYCPFKGASGQASEPVSMGANVIDPTDWDARTMPTAGQQAPEGIQPAAVEPAPVEPAAVEPVAAVDPITPDVTIILEDMNDAQLRTVYEDEVGRKPHPAAKADTMRGSIQATRDEKTEAA
jgi:hypothetical protein